jgi:hypothetical protein
MGNSESKKEEPTPPQKIEVPMPKPQEPEPVEPPKDESFVRHYYNVVINKIKSGYNSVKSTASEAIDSSFVVENIKTTQEKWEKIKANIDKIDLEVSKILKLKNYFFEGALIGSTIGFIYGVYAARKKHKFMKIPVATIGMGVSVGVIFACVPMVQQETYDQRIKKIVSNQNLIQAEHFSAFWIKKYLRG